MAAGMTIGQIMVRLGIDPSGLSSGFTQVESSMERMGNRLFYMGGRMSAGITVPLVTAGAAVAKFGLDFDKAMTESLAIMSGVTPQIRKQMEDTAMAVSDATKFSSQEVAEAYYDLASAGLTASESVGSVGTVAKFAQAGVMDLAKAGEYLAGSVSAVGLESIGAANKIDGMAKVADVLTTANNAALGTIEDFAKALTNKSGQALRMYNKSLEEGVAMLMAYAEQNIKGAVAGNQAYIAMRDLQRASVREPEAWKKLGIEVFDATGKMNNMATIIRGLETAFVGLSDKQVQQAFASLGMQDRSKAATMALIGMSDEMQRYERTLRSAAGATDEVANNQMQALKNQLLQLWHQFQNVTIQIFNQFRPAIEQNVIPLLEDGIELMRGWRDGLEGMSTSQKTWIMGLMAAAAALGPVITFVGSLLLFVRAITSPLEKLAQAIGMSGVAGAAQKAAPQLGAVSRIFQAIAPLATRLGGLLAAWPGVIAAVVLWVKNLSGSWSEFYDLLSGLTLGLLPLVVNQFLNMLDVFKEIGVWAGDIISVVWDIGRGIYNGVAEWLSKGIDKIEEFGRKLRGVGRNEFDKNDPDELRNVTAGWAAWAEDWADGGDDGWSKFMDAMIKDAAAKGQSLTDARLKAMGSLNVMPGGLTPEIMALARTNGALVPPGLRELELENKAEAEKKIREYEQLISKLKDAEDAFASMGLAEFEMGGKLSHFVVDQRLSADKKWRDEVNQRGMDFMKQDLARWEDTETAKRDFTNWVEQRFIEDHEKATKQLEAIDAAYRGFKNDQEEQAFNFMKSRLDATGHTARQNFEMMRNSGVHTASEIRTAWDEWFEKDFANRNASTLGWGRTLATLSTGFQKLADIAGDSIGRIVQWVGSLLAGLELIVQAQQEIARGTALWKDGFKLEGAASVVSGLASITASFLQATGAGNTFQRVLGGVITGAQAGAAIGGAFGGAPGAAIGAGIGAIGGGLTGLFRGLFGKSEAEKLRDQFILASGGLTVLKQRAREAGVSINTLLTARNDKAITAAVENVRRELERVAALQERYNISWNDFAGPRRLQELGKEIRTIVSDLRTLERSGVDSSAALRAMKDDFYNLALAAVEAGEEIPAALAPFLLQLAQAGELTEGQAQALLNMAELGGVAFADLEEAAERYGIKIEELGPKIRQLKMDEVAAQLVEDWDLFMKAGADMNVVMTHMADEIQDMISQAMQYGMQIPSTMRPMIEAMMRAGLLTDENGNKLEDLSRINFAEPIESAINRLISKLDELIERLGGAASALAQLPGSVDIPVNLQWPDIPSSITVPTGGSSTDRPYESGPGSEDIPFKPFDGIDTMARGGIVTGPTKTWLGEAGPEAVIPLGRYGSNVIQGNFGGQGVSDGQLREEVAGLRRDMDRRDRMMSIWIRDAVRTAGR